MTSLAVSLSVDARGPCAIYIITDSRITWNSSEARWDSGQKAFSSKYTPDIFGFCGDFFFPHSILHQLIEQINSGIFFSGDEPAEMRHKMVLASLKSAMDKRHSAPLKAYSIYHGAREDSLMLSKFRLWKSDYYVSSHKWYDQELTFATDHSYLVKVDGSGRNSIEHRLQLTKDHKDRNTSRLAIQNFCQSLKSNSDPFSGGAPQLVGIWRKGMGRNFGFIWNEGRYFAGLEMVSSYRGKNTMWFNENFEVCDGNTGQRTANTQRNFKP